MKKVFLLVFIVVVAILATVTSFTYLSQSNGKLNTNERSSNITNENTTEQQVNTSELSLINGNLNKEFATIFINEPNNPKTISNKFLGFNPPERFQAEEISNYESYMPSVQSLTNIDGEFAFKDGLFRYPVGCSSLLFNPYTSEYKEAGRDPVVGVSIESALNMAKSRGMDMIYVVNVADANAITRSSCNNQVSYFPTYEERINYIINNYKSLRNQLGMTGKAYFHIGNEDYAVMRKEDYQVYFDLAKRFTKDIKTAFPNSYVAWIAPSSNSPTDPTILEWFGRLNTEVQNCSIGNYCPDAYSVQTYPNRTEDAQYLVNGQLTQEYYDESINFMNTLMIKEQSSLRINGFNNYPNLKNINKVITEFNTMCERYYLLGTFYQTSMLSNYIIEMMKGNDVNFVNYYQLNYIQNRGDQGCAQILDTNGQPKSIYGDLETFKLLSILKGNQLLSSTDNNRFTYNLPETMSCEDHFGAGRYNYECVRGEYLIDNSYLNHIATYNQELGTLDIIINNISKSPMFLFINANGYTIQNGVETTLASLIENLDKEVSISTTNPKLFEPGFGLDILPRSVNLLRIPVQKVVNAGSEIEVFAKGDSMGGVKPKFSILINDQVVGAFDVESEFKSYKLKTLQPIKDSDKITTRFLNDSYFQPSTIQVGPFDRNIEFSKVIIDGKEIKVSDPGVMLNGQYSDGACRRIESPSTGAIHCGYANNEDGEVIFRNASKLSFTISGLDIIENQGSRFEIYVNDRLLASGETKKDVRKGEFETIEFNYNRKLNASDKVKIALTNDFYNNGLDRNLSVKSFKYDDYYGNIKVIELIESLVMPLGTKIKVTNGENICIDTVSSNPQSLNCGSTLYTTGNIEFYDFLSID